MNEARHNMSAINQENIAWVIGGNVENSRICVEKYKDQR